MHNQRNDRSHAFFESFNLESDSSVRTGNQLYFFVYSLKLFILTTNLIIFLRSFMLHVYAKRKKHEKQKKKQIKSNNAMLNHVIIMQPSKCKPSIKFSYKISSLSKPYSKYLVVIFSIQHFMNDNAF